MHALHSSGFQHSQLTGAYQRFLTSGKSPSDAGPGTQHTYVPEKSRDAVQVFQTSLSKHYQQVSTRSISPVATADEPLSAETVANNILGFIEQRLGKEEAAGASSEQLQQRLQEGLAGFKKGFAEAKEKIEALNLLSAEVAEEIGQTYDLVVAGIDDLRERFVDKSQAQTDTEATPENLDKLANSAAQSASVGQVSYAQANSFNFEVETADGDIVTIAAKSKDFYHAEYQTGSYSQGDRAGAYEQFNSYATSSDRFHLRVAGELDDDELQALDQLLGKVEDLSADFFAGNLDAAMQQALNMGYNTNEIVGYSLNLRQVEVQRVAVVYQDITPAATPINPLADKLQPLGNFAKELLDAVEVGNKFADPLSLLADLGEQVDINRPATDEQLDSKQRFSDFMKNMLDALPQQRDR